MPVYECSLPTCSNQYTDGTPRRSMYCVYHRTMEPMRPDAGADLEIKISPLEIERDKYREALRQIRSTAGQQTGSVGRIILKISRLASEALENG